MKALTIQHPWVDAILSGAKTLEVRSWDVEYRGDFLLHAAKAWGRKQQDLYRFVYERYGVRIPQPEHPGQNGIVGIARLAGIRPILKAADARKALAEPGDFGLEGWVLEDVRPLDFIPCDGALGLWNVPPAIAAKVNQQLAQRQPELIG